jgi:hypothetical protein
MAGVRGVEFLAVVAVVVPLVVPVVVLPVLDVVLLLGGAPM